MSQNVSIESDPQFAALWESAYQKYQETAKIDLKDPEFPKPSSSEELFSLLDHEEKYFRSFREKKRVFFKTIQAVLIPLEVMGDTAGTILAVAFPPAPIIMGAVLFLIRGGRGVSGAFDSIIGVFDEVKNFTARLNTYKGAIITQEMKDIVSKVLVNVLQICALSRKIVKYGRVVRWMKNTFLQDTEIQDALANLKDLTLKEHYMIGALTLSEVHEARKEGHGTNIRVNSIDVKSHETYNILTSMRADQSKDDERKLLERVKKALEPISESESVYNTILNKRLPDSYQWLKMEPVFQAWLDQKQPLLWIHGAPGVGKSYLASTIISLLTEMHQLNTTSASKTSVAFFFCQDNDEKLRSCNKMLRTLIWQVAKADTVFAEIVDDFCQREDASNSRGLWKQLFVKYFNDRSQKNTIYIVLDGLDEVLSHERDDFLCLLEETFQGTGLNGPLRIQLAMISRQNQRIPLEEHSFGHLPEIPIVPGRNSSDIAREVSRRLDKVRALRRRNELKEEIIETITERADGLWVWAGLALEALLKRDSEASMREALHRMPRGIPEMLHHELERLSNDLNLSDDKLKHLNLLLTWVSCAEVPLTLEQLDIIIEMDEGEKIFDLEGDLRTTYSSMFKVRTETLETAEDDYYETTDNQDSISEEESSNTDFEDGFGSDPKTTTVVLHHTSFYDFFREHPKTTAVGVDQHSAQLHILKTCFSLFCDDKRSSYDKTGALADYAYFFFPDHLEKIDCTVMSLEDKQECAGYLISMFSRESTIKRWAVPWPGNICEQWLRGNQSNVYVERISSWLRDRDVNSTLTEGHRAWITSDHIGSHRWLLKPIVDTFAKVWLEWDADCYAESAVDSFLVLRAFRNLMSSDADSASTGQTSSPTKSSTSDQAISITHPEEKPPREDSEIGSSSTAIREVAEGAGLEKTSFWHARVAQVLREKRHYDDAIEEFKLAINKNSTFLWLSHTGIARAYAKKRQFEAAIYHMETSFEHYDVGEQPQAADLLELARWQAGIGQFDGAMKSAKRGLDISNSNEFYSNVDRYLELLGRHKKCAVLMNFVEDLGTARANESVDSKLTEYLLEYPFDAYTSISAAAQVEKKVDFVCRAYETAIKAATKKKHYHSVTELWYSMGLLYEMMGDDDKALYHWDHLLSGSNLKLDDSEGQSFKDRVRRHLSIFHLNRAVMQHREMKTKQESIAKLRLLVSFIINNEEVTDDAALACASMYRLQGTEGGELEPYIRIIIKQALTMIQGYPDLIGNYFDLVTALLHTKGHQTDLDAAVYLVKAQHQAITNANPVREENLPFLSLTCDGCETPTSNLIEVYLCRKCLCISICQSCHQQIEDKSRRLKRCWRYHEYYYTGSALKDLKPTDDGLMNVGEELVPIKDWMAKLKRRWDL